MAAFFPLVKASRKWQLLSILLELLPLLTVIFFPEPTYSTLQTSLVMTTQAPRNGNLQDGGSVCSQTLGHLPTARVLSPNFLTTSQSGLTTACTVIPSAQRPASGRVVYVDSATGRVRIVLNPFSSPLFRKTLLTLESPPASLDVAL